MCQMLLSINPEHVENILLGTKRFEFRKVRCKVDVDKIIIYATSPVMRIVAEAEVSEIIEDNVEAVWEITKKYAAISHEFFESYYEGKNKAVAYKLTKVKKYKEPKMLSDYGLRFAPQSFVYLSPAMA
jgi:predicted transcriptional regulator